MNSFKIGHYTDRTNLTGCSVILCPESTIASCYINGSAPGSRETALLAPERKIQHIHALLFSGGSAFGLAAADGVVHYLEEMGVGYETPFARVPIVPAAVIYDLNVGHAGERPQADHAYAACKDATSDFSRQGSIGAGTGATVGKWMGIENAMKGGLGTALEKHDHLWVCALVIVNSVGDIVDEKGAIVAGALNEQRKFHASSAQSKRWIDAKIGFGQNTVLCAILTNARLTKTEAFIVSKRASSGLARSIYPVSTSYDGDIIFTLATGEADSDLDLTCELAAESVRAAVVSAVHHAEGLGGIPSVADLNI